VISVWVVRTVIPWASPSIVATQGQRISCENGELIDRSMIGSAMKKEHGRSVVRISGSHFDDRKWEQRQRVTYAIVGLLGQRLSFIWFAILAVRAALSGLLRARLFSLANHSTPPVPQNTEDSLKATRTSYATARLRWIRLRQERFTASSTISSFGPRSRSEIVYPSNTGFHGLSTCNEHSL